MPRGAAGRPGVTPVRSADEVQLGRDEPVKDHRLIDERSLALHRRIAERLRENPALIDVARDNIDRWLQDCAPGACPALLEWQSILKGSIEGVLDALLATNERAVRLRQSTPFAGCLDPIERTAILMEFQRRESRAA